MDREDISNFIARVVNGDNTAAKDDFENIIAQKLNDAIDQKKIEVAQSVYGTQGTEDSGEENDYEEGEEQEEEPEQESENAVQ